MKVAMLGDMHANLPALKAVLAQAERKSDVLAGALGRAVSVRVER